MITDIRDSVFIEKIEKIVNEKNATIHYIGYKMAYAHYEDEPTKPVKKKTKKKVTK